MYPDGPPLMVGSSVWSDVCIWEASHSLKGHSYVEMSATTDLETQV
jgi:hypothetical protein